MFSGLKEEKKGGKKDGDQMKITKARLVEIIKEEIENIDEIFNPKDIFGKTPKSQRSFSRAVAGDDLDVRAAEIEAGDSTAGLNRGQMKVYSAAIADATADAAKMDAETSQKDFERVMKWANDQDIATEKDAAKMDTETSQKDFERVMKWANDQGIATEKDIFDEDFIELLAKKIAQYKHTPGE